MANKIKVTPQKEEMLEREGPDSPLLDLSDAAVKDLIRGGKKRGYVTHNQINALLSSEEVKSEQIEDILVQLIFRDPSHRVGQDHTLQASQIDKG